MGGVYMKECRILSLSVVKKVNFMLSLFKWFCAEWLTLESLGFYSSSTAVWTMAGSLTFLDFSVIIHQTEITSHTGCFMEGGG